MDAKSHCLLPFPLPSCQSFLFVAILTFLLVVQDAVGHGFFQQALQRALEDGTLYIYSAFV